MLRIRLKAMTGRQWLTVGVVAIAAAGFALVVMTALGRLLSTPTAVVAGDETAGAPAAPNAAGAPAVPRIKATLFFTSEDGLRLVPTEQEVPLADGVVAQARSIVEAQLAAQAPPPLVSAIPKGSTLRGLFISDRNEAFVDLDPSIRSAHPGGTLHEMMTVYTIVHALVVNLPALQEVQILIGGQEVDTLAGHIDLRRPLRKNEGLIQPASPPAAPTQ